MRSVFVDVFRTFLASGQKPPPPPTPGSNSTRSGKQQMWRGFIPILSPSLVWAADGRRQPADRMNVNLVNLTVGLRGRGRLWLVRLQQLANSAYGSFKAESSLTAKQNVWRVEREVVLEAFDHSTPLLLQFEPRPAPCYDGTLI